MRNPRSILVELNKGSACVTLNRPDRRNAFDALMVEEIRKAFEALGQNHSVRTIVLTGSGSTFCAGADLHWMGADQSVSEPDAQQDAERLLAMFRTIDECPCPVIGRIQGAAYGGGIGLVAACDVAVTAADATFTFSEVRLGLVPAVIAPFVLAKVGISFVRRFCLTAEPFSAAIAQTAGLIHEMVEPAALDARVTVLAEQISHLAPQAVRDAKTLFHRLRRLSNEERWNVCIEGNVRARLSSEAREGFLAFRECRTPNWGMSTDVE